MSGNAPNNINALPTLGQSMLAGYIAANFGASSNVSTFPRSLQDLVGQWTIVSPQGNPISNPVAVIVNSNTLGENPTLREDSIFNNNNPSGAYLTIHQPGNYIVLSPMSVHQVKDINNLAVSGIGRMLNATTIRFLDIGTLLNNSAAPAIYTWNAAPATALAVSPPASAPTFVPSINATASNAVPLPPLPSFTVSPNNNTAATRMRVDEHQPQHTVFIDKLMICGKIKRKHKAALAVFKLLNKK